MNRTRLLLAAALMPLGTLQAGQLITEKLDVFGPAAFFGDVNIGWDAEGIPQDLALHYSMATNGNPVVDDSGNGKTGTVSGASWTSAGITNGAYCFDGVDDYISAGNVFDLSSSMTAMTVCAWVRFDGPDIDWPYIISKQDSTTPYHGWLLCLHGNQSPFVQVRHSTVVEVTGSSAMTAGEWHLMCATFEMLSTATVVRLYWDGIIEGVAVGPVGQATNSASMTIGARNAGASSHLDGCVDEVRIYERVLSSDDIAVLYTMGLYAGQVGRLNVNDLIVDNQLIQSGTGTNILMGPTGVGVTNPVGQLHVGGSVNVDGNIRLNNNWLSGDGDNEGVSVAPDGSVTIPKLTPQGDLTMGSFTNHP
jgi:hypothetical protein